jgi:hypothetical protein
MFSARRSESASTAGTTCAPSVRPAPDTQARWLRLVRGSAREPDRMLREAASGAIISVGSDPTCDWPIDGPGVPELALWIRVLRGSLFVRAAGTCAVSVDGQDLGSLWTPVAVGSRVSLGSAAFEVGLGGRSRTAQSERLQRGFGRIPDAFGAAEAACPASGEVACAPAADWLEPWPPETELPEPPTATIFDADYAGTAPDNERLQGRAALWTVASVGIAGGLFVCAYLCWVLLLDRL